MVVRRVLRQHKLSWGLTALGSLWSLQAGAQEPAPAAKSTLASEEAKIVALEAKLGAQSEAIAALQEAAEEAEMAAMMGDDEEEVEEPALKIYGFTDMGFQYDSAPNSLLGKIIESSFPVGATSFVIGNINLYLDVKPADNWRGLAEIRFTNAPQGDIDNFGVILGGASVQDFERPNVEQTDPHASTLNGTIWPGTTVIERAWLEYNKYQSARLRIGNFFTPFGIWNIDHGTPTLISLGMPQDMVQRYMPLRQTGLQLSGTQFSGD